MVGISRNSFVSSQKAVENYLGSKDEPIEAFKLRFHKLVIALGEETRLIVFIDDLDRCKSEFVVKILENIQTLFKEANVVFAIAADKKWIHACYEVEYEKMKGYVGVEGKTIGPLSVEKMFQLSVPLPGVHLFQKEKFWQHLIGLGDGPATYLDEHIIAVIDEASGVQERENLIKFAEQQGFERSHAVRREIVVRMAKKGTLKHTEHYLERYSKLLDVNPRSMKRLLNSFSVNQASSIISHLDIEPHQLILWTILSMRWPILCEYLTRYPGVIYPESVDGNSITTPENIKLLLQDAEVKSVLSGSDTGSGLSRLTIEKGRSLLV